MRVIVIHEIDDEGREHAISIRINNKEVIFVTNDLADAPEDANLDRDLEFVHDIPSMLESAFNSGLGHENFTIEHYMTHSIFLYDQRIGVDNA